MQSNLNSLNVALTATNHNTATPHISLVAFIGVLKSFLLQSLKRTPRLFLLAFTLVSCGSSSTSPSVTPPAVDEDGNPDPKPLT